jgi:hypothetical protein
MVLRFSNNSNNKHRSSHDDHHDGDGDDDDHHHPLVYANIMSIVEFLLKEIVGGVTLGRE